MCLANQNSPIIKAQKCRSRGHSKTILFCHQKKKKKKNRQALQKIFPNPQKKCAKGTSTPYFQIDAHLECCHSFSKHISTPDQDLQNSPKPINLPTNCLSVFDHFVKLALKGLGINLDISSHLSIDPLGLYISFKILLSFPSFLYIPPCLGKILKLMLWRLLGTISASQHFESRHFY